MQDERPGTNVFSESSYQGWKPSLHLTYNRSRTSGGEKTESFIDGSRQDAATLRKGLQEHANVEPFLVSAAGSISDDRTQHRIVPFARC
jgi:hypothetical protein